MKNLKAFFPEAIYYCDCLHGYFDDRYSLQKISEKINNGDSKTIFIVRCNKKRDVICCCLEHVTMKPFVFEYHSNRVILKSMARQNCLNCIKNFLQRKYFKYNYKTNADTNTNTNTNN